MSTPRRTRNGPRYRRFLFAMTLLVVLVFAAAYLLGRHS